jgi:hypothetical protein
MGPWSSSPRVEYSTPGVRRSTDLVLEVHEKKGLERIDISPHFS